MYTIQYIYVNLRKRQNNFLLVGNLWRNDDDDELDNNGSNSDEDDDNNVDDGWEYLWNFTRLLRGGGVEGGLGSRDTVTEGEGGQIQ